MSDGGDEPSGHNKNILIYFWAPPCLLVEFLADFTGEALTIHVYNKVVTTSVPQSAFE